MQTNQIMFGKWIFSFNRYSDWPSNSECGRCAACNHFTPPVKHIPKTILIILEIISRTYQETSCDSSPHTPKRRKTSSFWEHFRETVYQNSCLAIVSSVTRYIVSLAATAHFHTMHYCMASESMMSCKIRQTLDFSGMQKDKEHAPCTMDESPNHY